MKRYAKIRNIIASGLCTLALFGSAKNVKAEPNLSGDINAYYDTRGYPTTTLNLYCSDLPFKTDFYGFIDIFGSTSDPLNPDSYGEFSLKKEFWRGLGAKVEYDGDFNLPSGISRAGISYQPKIDGFFEVTLYPFSTHDAGGQIVLAGEKNFRNRDIYLRGFMDVNLKSEKIVGEVQFGKRLGDKKSNWYGIIEGRYNGFLEKNQQIGIGIGIERKF
jgi:hypothetical protein